MTGAARYGSTNNVKHGEMEDELMNFASETEARDTELTELTTTNTNLTTQFRQKEDQIWSLQAEMCNLKVSEAVQTNGHAPKGGGSSSMGRNPDMRTKNGCGKFPTDPTEKKYNNNNNTNCWLHGYDKSGPHLSPTCTETKYLHKKEGTCCNPMGVL